MTVSKFIRKKDVTVHGSGYPGKQNQNNWNCFTHVCTLVSVCVCVCVCEWEKPEDYMQNFCFHFVPRKRVCSKAHVLAMASLFCFVVVSNISVFNLQFIVCKTVVLQFPFCAYVCVLFLTSLSLNCKTWKSKVSVCHL